MTPDNDTEHMIDEIAGWVYTDSLVQLDPDGTAACPQHAKESR